MTLADDIPDLIDWEPPKSIEGLAARADELVRVEGVVKRVGDVTADEWQLNAQQARYRIEQREAEMESLRELASWHATDPEA